VLRRNCTYFDSGICKSKKIMSEHLPCSGNNENLLSNVLLRATQESRYCDRSNITWPKVECAVVL
jgi:hypothetical protein